jgi:hypothetical protein
MQFFEYKNFPTPKKHHSRREHLHPNDKPQLVGSRRTNSEKDRNPGQMFTTRYLQSARIDEPIIIVFDATNRQLPGDL